MCSAWSEASPAEADLELFIVVRQQGVDRISPSEVQAEASQAARHKAQRTDKPALPEGRRRENDEQDTRGVEDGGIPGVRRTGRHQDAPRRVIGILYYK